MNAHARPCARPYPTDPKQQPFRASAFERHAARLARSRKATAQLCTQLGLASSSSAPLPLPPERFWLRFGFRRLPAWREGSCVILARTHTSVPLFTNNAHGRPAKPDALTEKGEKGQAHPTSQSKHMTPENPTQRLERIRARLNRPAACAHITNFNHCEQTCGPPSMRILPLHQDGMEVSMFQAEAPGRQGGAQRKPEAESCEHIGANVHALNIART